MSPFQPACDTWEGAAYCEQHLGARGAAMNWWRPPEGCLLLGQPSPVQLISRSQPDRGCCVPFLLLKAVWELRAGQPQLAAQVERGSPRSPGRDRLRDTLLIFRGRILLEGSWALREVGLPHQRSVCFSRPGSKSQKLQGQKFPLFCLSYGKKRDEEVGLHILEIEKGITSYYGVAQPIQQ